MSSVGHMSLTTRLALRGLLDESIPPQGVTIEITKIPVTVMGHDLFVDIDASAEAQAADIVRQLRARGVDVGHRGAEVIVRETRAERFHFDFEFHGDEPPEAA